MNLKTLILSGMTALSLAAPLMAHADPEGWRGGDRGRYDRGGDRGGWRDEHDGWRGEHDGWRGDRDGWRAGWAQPYRWGYERRCWIERRGFYEPDGDYFVRAVRVCR